MEIVSIFALVEETVHNYLNGQDNYLNLVDTEKNEISEKLID